MMRNLIWHFRFYRGAIGTARTLFWLLLRPVMDILRPSTWHFYRMDKGFDLPPKKGMRVMLFSTDCALGSGAFRCCLGLAKTLREKGVDVFVVTTWYGDGRALLAKEKIPFTCVPLGGWIVPNDMDIKTQSRVLGAMAIRNIVATHRVRQLIRKYDVDVVHCNTIYSYMGALAASIERRPVVWHIRESLVGTKRHIVNERLGYELLNRSHSVLCVSDWIRREFRPFASKPRFLAVHDGVDPRRFYDGDHTILFRKPYTFVMMGNFQPKKCQLEFSRACVALYKQGVRDFRVWFIGGKGIEEKCGPIFDAGGLHDSVTYWGFQSEPEKIVRKADIAFMCSRAEAFGLVTVEAMLSGCLLIGSNTAGTPELIRNGETGLLFEFTPDECPDLVEKMRYAVEHPEEARRMAAAGREYMRQHKTLEVNADKVVEVYKNALECRMKNMPRRSGL